MSVSPYCPICRRPVEAAAAGIPMLLAAGRAEGWCQHTAAQRTQAEAVEDAQQAAIAKQKGGALPALPDPPKPGGKGL